MGNKRYEPSGRSFTEVIRSILNETDVDKKKSPDTVNGDIGETDSISIKNHQKTQ